MIVQIISRKPAQEEEEYEEEEEEEEEKPKKQVTTLPVGLHASSPSLSTKTHDTAPSRYHLAHRARRAYTRFLTHDASRVCVVSGWWLLQQLLRPDAGQGAAVRRGGAEAGCAGGGGGGGGGGAQAWRLQPVRAPAGALRFPPVLHRCPARGGFFSAR